MIGVSRVGLMPAKGNGQASVDASLVNPAISLAVAKPKSVAKKPTAKKPAAIK
jgi:hypothetical protein